MNQKYQAIIFDLDGTLVDSVEDIQEAMNKVLSDLNLPVHDQKNYRKFIGNGLRNLVSKALPDSFQKPEQIDESYQKMISIYDQACTHKTKPYSGVYETLDELKKSPIKLIVFSNKSEELTKKIVATFFPNTFDIIFGLTKESLRKPNPTKAIEISTLMEIPPENFLFIGDSDVDMETANNAKMIAIGVDWGYRSKENLVSSGAKQIIQHPAEIIELLIET